MASISLEARKVFAALLAQLGDQDAIQLNNDNSFMPLHVERLGAKQIASSATIQHISLAHYYTQNGDAMRDPEIVFYVVDARQKPDELNMLLVYPAEFRQDGTGTHHELIIFNEEGKPAKFMKRWQPDTAAFCTKWFRNLKYQQNIKP